jgi:outer membrane protein assembly factor BamB
MTLPRQTRRIYLFSTLALGAALLAGACSTPPTPQGWAAPQPVTVDGGGVLVAHKAKLYLLRGTSSADLLGESPWQFPPKDKTTFPISEQAQQSLTASIDALASVDDASKTRLKKLAAALMVSGSSKSALDTEIKNSPAPSDQRDKLTSAVDSAVAAESSALNSLKGFYGDIGLSTDGKTAFLTSFKGMVFALDVSNGHVRWVRNAGAGIVGGVAVDGDTIYFGTKGNRLYAVSATTGEAQWQFTTAGEVWATPTVDGDTIYVTSLDGSLYALDKSGNRKWKFPGAGSGIASRPVVSGDAVFVGAFDNKLYSVKKSDGTENWSLKAGNWFWATPLVRDGVVYAPSLDSKVYAVDAKTGTPKWAKPFDAGTEVRSAPVIAGGGLVVAARNGKVFKLDLATGQQSEGVPPTIAGTKILADLTTNGQSTIYVLPMSAVLYVIDASTEFSAVSVPLPQ